jgi:eukaryotic-like serine/threonine-protein kinase
MPEAATLEDRYLDRPYTLGGRVIDPIAGMAICAGERAVLKRKHLEVLACLAAAGTAMVSREAFIDLVWRGNALVGENGLNNAMSAVRRALQDTDAEKPLIRTIPRRGYQLTVAAGEVQEALPEAFAPGMPIAGKPGWHLVRRMGGNATSELWVAQEQTSGDKRAFRFCRSEQHLQALRRETTVLRYLREALAGRRDTAVVLDWQLDEPPYHLEMDYASGGTLAEWAAVQGGIARVAYAERLRLTTEVAEALAAVHAADVVHRNLGPSSVSIHGDQDEAELHAHLGEFGLSDLTDRSRLQGLQITSAGLTLTGEEAGEALYLPPEYSSGGKATAAGDVYAFGVLLLQMAVGDLQRAPGGDWEASVASQPLRELIAKCLSATPEARPNAAAVAEWLRAFAQAARDAGRSDLGASHAGVTPAPAPASAAAPPPSAAKIADPAIGGHIGPYRLIDTLGEGGMGAVYLAEQLEPVQRKVALKVVRTGMMSGDVRARFEAERQALALMHHANVASVFDAGNTPSGQPYFAMEYVQGQDITAHCDHLRLDFRARIALFLQVCDGVLHAHQKGLIHRDLKPGNILVSRAKDQPAAVKIIDFGVAKSLSGLLASHPAHTRLGSFVGTPAYSSPEQVSGPVANVDTRSDIYSLGVVLYQLLAGVTPYSDDELNRKTPVELARLLSGEHPPSPLVRYTSLSREEEQTIAERRSLTVEEMKAALGADVSWIVGKCLEVDPDDRYPSVLEVEKDLRRWLQNLPVQARPASRLYKMRKFVRRHRLGVAAATLGTLALLTATGAAIYGYVRAEKALEEAEMAAEFQVKQMQGIDPAAMGAGLRGSLREVIRTQGIASGVNQSAIAEELRQFEASTKSVNFTDVALRQLNDHNLKPALSTIDKDYADQPLLQARLWQSIAEIYSALGKNKDALAPQQRALDARRKLLGPGHRMTIESLIERSKLRNRMKEFALGEADLRAALALARRNLGEDDPLTITAASGLASTLGENSRYEEAEALQRKVLEARTRILGREHPDTVGSIESLAWILLSAGKARDALPYAEESLRLQREVVKNDRDLSLALNTLAMTYRALQRIEESEKLSREMLETDRRRLGSAHPTTLIDMNNLSMVLMDQGKDREAEGLMLQAIDAAKAEYVESDPLFALLNGTYSTLLFNQGRFVEAEAALVDVIAVRKKNYSDDHADTVFARADMARVLMQMGRYDEAAQTWALVLKWCQTNYGPDNPTATMLMQDLARALAQKGEYPRAGALLGQALNIHRRTASDADDRTLSIVIDIAVVQQQRGDLERAERLLRKVLAIQRRKTSKEDQANGALISTIEPLIEVLRTRGKFDEAVALGQEMIEAASRAYDPRHYLIGVYRTSHARTLTALRRFDEAERMLDGARANLAQGYNPNPEPVRELAQAYIALYDAWNADRPDGGLKAKADAWRTRLDAVNKAGAGRAAGLLVGG